MIIQIFCNLIRLLPGTVETNIKIVLKTWSGLSLYKDKSLKPLKFCGAQAVFENYQI